MVVRKYYISTKIHTVSYYIYVFCKAYRYVYRITEYARTLVSVPKSLSPIFYSLFFCGCIDSFFNIFVCLVTLVTYYVTPTALIGILAVKKVLDSHRVILSASEYYSLRFAEFLDLIPILTCRLDLYPELLSLLLYS